MVGPPIPLEDAYNDVVLKAQRGLKYSDEDLARNAGLPVEALDRFKTGAFDAATARKVAAVLRLGAEALVELGQNAWRREPLDPPGLASFSTPYKHVTVNAYLIFDAKAGAAAVFDTGASAAGPLDLAREKKLKIEFIFLTHTHPDHVADLAGLAGATGAPVYVGEREQFAAGQPIASGSTFRLGSLKIEARQTSGHAKGGMSYIATGLPRRLAVVGDALFAASMGGGLVSYEEALRTNRNELFSLPDDTVVCPGHGPLTTIGGEKKHNPFFPEFQK